MNRGTFYLLHSQPASRLISAVPPTVRSRNYDRGPAGNELSASYLPSTDVPSRHFPYNLSVKFLATKDLFFWTSLPTVFRKQNRSLSVLIFRAPLKTFDISPISSPHLFLIYSRPGREDILHRIDCPVKLLRPCRSLQSRSALTIRGQEDTLFTRCDPTSTLLYFYFITY